ncbi:sensor histidine kinase [Marinicauda pacifica]|uniref:ATP-binding protein n=1 Tax=Marinicauda pacifica TaxID=1133559 RepID=UPI0019C3F879|nr:sensor histidine kinase [Marinicauda pacifica]GGE51004.1 sensor histidine kinase [Marinicauda pacifica]
MNEQPSETLTRKGSLVRRVTLTAISWSAALLLVGALALTLLFRQTILSDLDNRLSDVGEFLVVSAEVETDGSLGLVRPPADTRYGQIFSGRYWQIAPAEAADPERTLRSRSLWDESLAIPDSLRDRALARRGQGITGSAKGPNEEPLRLFLRAIEISGLDQPILVAVGEDRRAADRRVFEFALLSLGLFTAFALALVAGILIQVRVSLAPVFRMGRAVGAVRDGQSERITGAYPAELMPLAGELNALVDHSREVVERARTHVGNLAHALKTPITVLSNEARNADGPLAELVRRQSDAMAAQVEHHLRRARAAANARAIGARTPVTPVVEDLSRTLEKIHRRKGVEIEVELTETLLFRGERQDLEELVGNLLENACKWAERRVRIRAGQGEAGQIEIRIEDDGPGLSEAERQAVLGRGVRLDEQAPGTGLGLAIVTDLAKAYGGTLVLETGTLGGLCARLILPQARQIRETPR